MCHTNLCEFEDGLKGECQLGIRHSHRLKDRYHCDPCAIGNYMAVIDPNTKEPFVDPVIVKYIEEHLLEMKYIYKDFCDNRCYSRNTDF